MARTQDQIDTYNRMIDRNYAHLPVSRRPYEALGEREADRTWEEQHRKTLKSMVWNGVESRWELPPVMVRNTGPASEV